MCVGYEAVRLGEAGHVGAAGDGGLDPLEDRVQWRQIQRHSTQLTTISKSQFSGHIDQSVLCYPTLHQDGSG
jgi:hypothetical protein